MKQLLKYVAITASLLGSASVSAAIINFGPNVLVGNAGIYNGNKYAVVESTNSAGFTWEDARDTAQSLGGHLATITSAGENDFVFNLVKNTVFGNGINEHNNENIGAWLGGERGKDGKFSWITGEAFTYTNWLTGEPNNFGSNENYLHYYFTSVNDSTWNDYPNNGWSQYNGNDGSFVRAFIVEHSVSPVPVPAAAFLFAPALIGFIGLRRKAANKA
jgi:hypothetical protein